MSQGLLEITSATEAAEAFSWERLWALFDGDDDRLNIAHECLDRHDPEGVAARIVYSDGRVDQPTFGELSRATSQFAHELERRGIAAGQPVGIMMEPSREFYSALFGVLKRGAVAVPLYTLFGPDAVRDRMEDCGARLLVVDGTAEPAVRDLDCEILRYDEALAAECASHPEQYAWNTTARDPAVLQYTSGTSRQMPEGVPHDHRAIVTLARAALFGVGLKPGDRYFCPSSPAWGHGLWHGTVSPWALGIAVGTYSGRFDADRLIDALVSLEITNFAAASTVYRMILRSGRAHELRGLKKASYTGEELDATAQEAFHREVGIPIAGMYGTTETGVILVNFPGFTDHEPRPGTLGKPMPGCQVAVLGDDGSPAPVGKPGEIHLRRRGSWFPVKDLGSVDEEGYFYYGGRADDVIISAGWTISPLEVERTLLSHPDVAEAAVIGVPDETRGLIVKAFVIANRDGDDFTAELQQHVRSELSPHEYPRQVEFVSELPKTTNGKINRKALRDMAASG